eukprot:455272-Amphidinium_carterae.2
MNCQSYVLGGEATQYKSAYNEDMPPMDTKETSLFCIEPSGMVFKYKGTAVGKGKQAAKTEVEKVLAPAEGITCAEARVAHSSRDNGADTIAHL